jgi:flagellar hook-length control protein FliK
MSVERSSAPSAPKSAGSGQVGHAKGKSHPAGGASPADTGDFSALLMTLGADDAGDLAVGQDALMQPPVDDAVVLDPGLLLAQSMQLQADLPKTTSAPGKGELAAKGAALVAVKTGRERGVDTLQAVKTGPERTGDALPAVQAGSKRSADALQTGADSTQPAAAQLLATAQDDGKLPAAADGGPQEKKELPLAALGTPKSHAANDASQSITGRLAAEEHANKLTHAESRMAQSAALPQMVLATGMGESGARQTERATERSAFKQIGGSEGGVWGHQALVEAGRIDPPAPTTGAAGLSPEMMVAEQVNYWIGRDVQNAELKLDGLGDSPVKVNISLQGNEARIEFRTDQAEARQVLEGAVSHLKDLLGNEGLVLSSVSVGSSGAGAGDPKDRKTPQHSRQIAVSASEALAGEAALRPARLSGRTVDLFV